MEDLVLNLVLLWLLFVFIVSIFLRRRGLIELRFHGALLANLLFNLLELSVLIPVVIMSDRTSNALSNSMSECILIMV